MGKTEHRKTTDAPVPLSRQKQSGDDRLKELAETWNPLVAERARQQYLEDVNSLIKDHVRRIQRSLAIKPVAMDRVRNLSAQIAANGVFAEIRRKNELREYIQLYVVRLLEKARPPRAKGSENLRR